MMYYLGKKCLIFTARIKNWYHNVKNVLKNEGFYICNIISTSSPFLTHLIPLIFLYSPSFIDISMSIRKTFVVYGMFFCLTHCCPGNALKKKKLYMQVVLLKYSN